MIRKLPFLLITVIVGMIISLAGMERQIVSPGNQDLSLPFSPGILSEDFLFVSGSSGNVPGTRQLAGKDIESQTRQALENIGQVLRAGGMDFSDVVSSNVYLADVRHFQTMNSIYSTYFRQNPPTRATVETDQVLAGALLEISMIALHPRISRHVVTPQGWSHPTSPYSWGIQAGDTLFIAGMVSRKPSSDESVLGDIGAQTRQVLQNVGTVLRRAGMDYGDVVSSRVFLSDARDFRAMNDVYRTFFTTEPPVRATVRARLASLDFKVEIQCVAVKDATRKVVGTPRLNSPFSPGIRVGKRLYLAGMVGRGPQGLELGDVKAQTRQTLLNLESVLKAGGLDLGNVVDATVFLSDVRYYNDMNEIYSQIMPEGFPARATVGTPLMSPSALVEIMMTAVEE